MKYMPVQEFLDFGYLHELNRQFLHPLGLALDVIEEEDGSLHLNGIQDFRDQVGGYTFAEKTLDPAKVSRVADEIVNRASQRRTTHGYWIQPVSYEKLPVRTDQG